MARRECAMAAGALFPLARARARTSSSSWIVVQRRLSCACIPILRQMILGGGARRARLACCAPKVDPDASYASLMPADSVCFGFVTRTASTQESQIWRTSVHGFFVPRGVKSARATAFDGFRLSLYAPGSAMPSSRPDPPGFIRANMRIAPVPTLPALATRRPPNHS
jgi:hypothetical protein